MKKETGINPVLFNTFQDAVIALSKGKIDAVIGNLAVASHTIKKLSITNLKFQGMPILSRRSFAWEYGQTGRN